MYYHTMYMIVCFCITILSYTHERELIMHNNQLINDCSSFKAHDKYGTLVTIEWQADGMFAKRTLEKMTTLWECAKLAYVPIEMNFLKAFPEVVGMEPYYKPFEHLFEQGIDMVNWNQAQTIMEGMLERHFVIDASHIPQAVLETYAHDCSIIITVKNEQTQELLGFMTFMIRKDYPAGTVKAIAAGVLPSEQTRGLGKLMMASLCNIMPTIKRIFLTTRITNTQALRAYESWGFVQDANPQQDQQHMFNLNHWVFMDYDATRKDILQKAAATLTKE
jgi:GNAT superfamily N-acetyltransferase